MGDAHDEATPRKEMAANMMKEMVMRARMVQCKARDWAKGPVAVANEMGMAVAGRMQESMRGGTKVP